MAKIVYEVVHLVEPKEIDLLKEIINICRHIGKIVVDFEDFGKPFTLY